MKKIVLQTALQIAKLMPLLDESSNQSLNFFVPNSSDTDTFIDLDLPAPSYLVPVSNGYYIGWNFTGFSNTAKSKEFKNDINEKIALALKAEITKKPPRNIHNHFFTNNTYELKTITENLIDLRVQYSSEIIYGSDDLFNAIRAKAYLLKKQNILTYESLLSYSISIALSVGKTVSVAKAKAKNIFVWVRDKYNGKTNKRVSKNNRVDSAKIARDLRSDNIKNKIIEYIKSNRIDINSISSYKLAKLLNISYVSVKKYLSEYISTRDVARDIARSMLRALPLMVQPQLKSFSPINRTLWINQKMWENYIDISLVISKKITNECNKCSRELRNITT